MRSDGGRSRQAAHVAQVHHDVAGLARAVNDAAGGAGVADVEDLDAFRASVASSDTLANGTNAGMGKPEGISALPDTSVLRPDLFDSDVVYAPEKSHFLEQAEAAGCQYMNGLDMMYNQGAASFKMWTGQDMPLDHVREHMADES